MKRSYMVVYCGSVAACASAVLSLEACSALECPGDTRPVMGQCVNGQLTDGDGGVILVTSDGAASEPAAGDEPTRVKRGVAGDPTAGSSGGAEGDTPASKSNRRGGTGSNTDGGREDEMSESSRRSDAGDEHDSSDAAAGQGDDSSSGSGGKPMNGSSGNGAEGDGDGSNGPSGQAMGGSGDGSNGESMGNSGDGSNGQPMGNSGDGSNGQPMGNSGSGSNGQPMGDSSDGSGAKSGDGSNDSGSMSGGGSNSGKAPQPSSSGGSNSGQGNSNSMGGSGTNAGSSTPSGSSGSRPNPRSTNSGRTRCSSPGTIRCTENGRGREECSDGVWTTIEACRQDQVCGGPDSSDPGACLEVSDFCRNKEGQKTCNGSGIRFECDDDGVIVGEDSCGTDARCMASLDRDDCVACVPGELKCEGAELFECQNTDGNFESRDTCASEDHCNEGVDLELGGCAKCLADTFECQEAKLFGCKPDEGFTEEIETCPSAEQCNAADGNCDGNPTPPMETMCTGKGDGERVCEGAALHTCGADGAIGNTEICDSVALCNLGVEIGHCAKCEQDRFDCEDSKLKKCVPADGFTEEVEVCPSPEHCSAGRESGFCARCLPDTFECHDAKLVKCRPGEGFTEEVQTCDSVEQCNAGERRCTDAAPTPPMESICANKEGQHVCEGASFHTCGPAGSIANTDPCETNELCELGIQRGFGRCARCKDGEYRCDLAELLSCDPYEGFTSVINCGSEELCNAAEGRCNEPPPTICDGKEGQQLCQDGVMYTCGANGSVDNTVTCTAYELCDIGLEYGLGTCAKCDPRVFQCDLADLIGCDPAEGIKTLINCGSEELCNAAEGRCNEPPPTICTGKEGQQLCQDGVMYTCGANGSVDNTETCAAYELCDIGLELVLGRCAQCKPGEFYCEGANLMACEPGIGFTPIECGSEDLCNAAEGRCNEPAPTVCTGNDGRQVCQDGVMFTCGANGSVDNSETCTAYELCDIGLEYGLGTCAKCIPGEFQCDLADLVGCDPAQGLTALINCGSEDLCNAAEGRCDEPPRTVCTGNDGQQVCQDGVMYTCGAGGSVDFTETCSAFELCQIGLDLVLGRCAQCVPGQYYCDGATLMACEPGIGFTPVNCGEPALCNAAAGTCNPP